MQGDPGAASLDETMKIIEEKGWDKEARTAPGLCQSKPSLWSTYPTAEETSPQSKDDPPSTDKDGQ